MSIRRFTTFVLCLAILAGGTLGTANGMVLCVDAAGRVAIEPPHRSHADAHDDDAAHDHETDADHADHTAAAGAGDGHGQAGDCSDSRVILQKVERCASALAADLHHVAAPEFCLPASFARVDQPSPPAQVAGTPASLGGTAHLDLARLSTVILLV